MKNLCLKLKPMTLRKVGVLFLHKCEGYKVKMDEGFSNDGILSGSGMGVPAIFGKTSESTPTA